MRAYLVLAIRASRPPFPLWLHKGLAAWVFFSQIVSRIRALEAFHPCCPSRLASRDRECDLRCTLDWLLHEPDRRR